MVRSAGPRERGDNVEEVRTFGQTMVCFRLVMGKRFYLALLVLASSLLNCNAIRDVKILVSYGQLPTNPKAGLLPSSAIASEQKAAIIVPKCINFLTT